MFILNRIITRLRKLATEFETFEIITDLKTSRKIDNDDEFSTFFDKYRNEGVSETDNDENVTWTVEISKADVPVLNKLQKKYHFKLNKL